MKEPSKVSGRVEVADDCAYYRPAGKMTLDEAVELVDQTIAYVRDQRIPKLLFNAKALVGFPSPSLPTRYFAARRFAETGKGLVQLAMVIQAAHIDPEKFGVIVARNSGLNADVFSEEKEALEWLENVTGS
ncbi:MAG TPA: hypothetical protein VFZ59_23570 [Verrucomicrobiae bacterium]|nr:hypothetical protein [Verrucomicrobiae bacterium]